jgi:hypothetical protein
MSAKLGTWAVAATVALLSGVVAFWLTRPPSPAVTTNSAFAGRDRPSTELPDPLSADEIGYRVPRDKIRAITSPTFVARDQAGFVPEGMPVLGVAAGHEAKAYPIPLLSRTEIVNDRIDGRAIAVTW